MKSVFFSSLSALVLCLSLSSGVKAETTQTTPFDLVNLARTGYFQDRGIPSHANFKSAVRAGKIHAKDLVKAAISDKRIAPETINDLAYLNSLEMKLKNFSRR
jgi:hypothetical protein